MMSNWKDGSLSAQFLYLDIDQLHALQVNESHAFAIENLTTESL